MTEQLFEQIYNSCNNQNNTQEETIDLNKNHEEKRKELTESSEDNSTK